MIKYNQLHIPDPCQIDFNSLPFDSEKRPCSTCKKPVYDFRNKDEKYFNEIWQKYNGDFCGAFKYDQFDQLPIKTNSVWSIDQFKTSIFGFLLGFWSIMTKAEIPNSKKHQTIELTPSDSTSNKNNITIQTKECKNCIDEFYVTVSVNNNLYGNFKVNDSTIINFPDTLKPTDIIKIEQKKRIKHYGFIEKVRKMKTVQFKFGDRSLVELKATNSSRLTLIYRRSWIGCPKFR